MLTRRQFVTATTATIAAHALPAQTAHIDVAVVERPRVLEEAKTAIAANPTGIRGLSTTAATLAAAFLLTKEEPYATRAGVHLMTLSQIQVKPDDSIMDLVPAAEAAVALRFLVDDLPQGTLVAINGWLAALQTLLNTARPMLITRDTHDHRASSWLLLSAAIARSQRDEKMLDAARARFRRPTLRNQINYLGLFPEEMATPNPYRNTLFNFDLLCGVCQILASSFDLLWDFDLPDGPGLRVVAASLFPMIQDRGKWTGISDHEHFRDLPGRRPGLLFAGRAYSRPEYVELWQSLPVNVPPWLEDTFPIREPLLWTTRASHGL